MKQNNTTDINTYLSGIYSIYLSLIKYDDNKKELGNLAVIGIILELNILFKDTKFLEENKFKSLNPYFSYNTDYKTINELRLYFNTNENKDKENKSVRPFLLTSDDCINNNLCYTTIDIMFERDQNSSDLIKENYDDIEKYLYMDLINTIKDKIDISDTIKDRIKIDYENINSKIQEKGYKATK